MPTNGCLRSVICEPSFEKQVPDPLAGCSIEARSTDPDDLPDREFTEAQNGTNYAADGFADELRWQIASKQRVDPTIFHVRRLRLSREDGTDLQAPPSLGDSL